MVIDFFKGQTLQSHPGPSHPSLRPPRQGSATREKPPGRREVIHHWTTHSFILVCAFLHCHQCSSHSHLFWFSNWYPVALKNQKGVFPVSQMLQHLDCSKPKRCWLATSRPHSYNPVVNNLFHIICSELKKKIKKTL